MEIKFTIHGNQDDPEGNPVPYVRSTRGALWRPDGRRYAEWKGYVQKCFWRSRDLDNEAIAKLALNAMSDTKPIGFKRDRQTHMHIKIFWRNGAHGDPDNVWKGIADALFANDKNLDGSFESQIALDGRGRVEAEIKIN